MTRYDNAYEHKCPLCGKETIGFDYWRYCCGLKLFPLIGDTVSRSIKIGNEVEPQYREGVRNREILLKAMEILSRVDWFMKWLVEVQPDTTPYIYNEWLRDDPPCTGTNYRQILRMFKEGMEDD